MNISRPRTRDWRRVQVSKHKQEARQRVDKRDVFDWVQWEDRRYARQQYQMNHWYSINKPKHYPWPCKGCPQIRAGLPWYTWQTEYHRRLWDIAWNLKNRPRLVGILAQTPRTCSRPQCCKRQRVKRGMKPSEARRATPPVDWKEERQQEEELEVLATYSGATLDDVVSFDDEYDDWQHYEQEAAA